VLIHITPFYQVNGELFRFCCSTHMRGDKWHQFRECDGDWPVLQAVAINIYTDLDIVQLGYQELHLNDIMLFIAHIYL